MKTDIALAVFWCALCAFLGYSALAFVLDLTRVLASQTVF
jgi:hypothetical protein